MIGVRVCGGLGASNLSLIFREGCNGDSFPDVKIPRGINRCTVRKNSFH